MDITQMVDKYDKTFFKGELKNKVDYRWSTFSEGWRETAGVAFPKIKYPKIWIELNRRIAKNKRGALHRVRSTLVHEMIHAYCMLKKTDDNSMAPNLDNGWTKSMLDILMA